jgi:hypothetical protein
MTASETSTPGDGAVRDVGAEAGRDGVRGPQPMSRILWCGWMWVRRKAASLVAVREEWGACDGLVVALRVVCRVSCRWLPWSRFQGRYLVQLVQNA